MECCTHLGGMELFGFLIESLVIRDLRVYAQAADAEVFDDRVNTHAATKTPMWRQSSSSVESGPLSNGLKPLRYGRSVASSRARIMSLSTVQTTQKSPRWISPASVCTASDSTPSTPRSGSALMAAICSRSGRRPLLASGGVGPLGRPWARH